MRYCRSNRRNPLVPAPKEPTEVLDAYTQMDFDPSFNCTSSLGLSFPGLTPAALKLANSTLETSWRFGTTGGFLNFWVYYRSHPGAVNQTIASKRLNATGTNAGWQVLISPTGFVSLVSEDAGGTTQTVTSATALSVNTLYMISVDVQMSGGQTRIWIYINGVVSTNILLSGLRYTSTTVNMAIGALSDGVSQDCRSIVDRILWKQSPETVSTNITYLYNLGGGRTWAETATRFTVPIIAYLSAGDPTLKIFPNYAQTAQRGEYVQHPSATTPVILETITALREEPFRPQIDSTVPGGVFTGVSERYSENIGNCEFRLTQVQRNTGAFYGLPKADLGLGYLAGPVAFTEPHGDYSNRNTRTEKTCLYFENSPLKFTNGEMLKVLSTKNQVEIWIVFGPNKYQDTEVFSIRDGLGSDRFTLLLDSTPSMKILFRQLDSEASPQVYNIPNYINQFKYQVLRVRLNYIQAEIDAFLDGEYIGKQAMTQPAAQSAGTSSSEMNFGTGPTANDYFGDIARILIFDQILDSSSASYLEKYIQYNYDTYLGRATI